MEKEDINKIFEDAENERRKRIIIGLSLILLAIIFGILFLSLHVGIILALKVVGSIIAAFIIGFMIVMGLEFIFT